MSRESILKLYEQEAVTEAGSGELLFRLAALCSCAFFGLFGFYLSTRTAPLISLEESTAPVRHVSFVVEAPRKPPPVKPKKEIAPKADEKTVDLTRNPVLGQKVEDAAPENENAETKKPVRRVYGLRRVYATGLGAGGEMADAVIGKQGNTLNAPIDTVTPTKDDLAGSVVPVTTITSAPRLLKNVKPEYTKEMIDAEVAGLVRAQLLVGADGRVREVRILNDLGYGTRERAIEAFLQWVFEPARRGSDPVAVWITYAIRFVLLEN